MARQLTLGLAAVLAVLVPSALVVEEPNEACSADADRGAFGASRACLADGDHDDLSALQRSATTDGAGRGGLVGATLAWAASSAVAASTSASSAASPGAAEVVPREHPEVRTSLEPSGAMGTSRPGPHGAPREAPRLARWGHASQLLPVAVILVFGFRKITEVFKKSACTFSVRSAAEASVALALYCVSGPAVILLNKHIMKDYGFHFPVLLASLGNVFLMIATRVAVVLGWKKLDSDHLEWKLYFTVVVPMNVLNFLSQTLGMAAYEFISVPEIQIMKSVTIVMVLLFAWLLANEEINTTLLCSILLIAAGVGLSAVHDSEAQAGGGSTSRTLIGVALMILASASEAAKTVMSQLLVRNMPLFDGIYYSGPSFAILAAAVVWHMEREGLARFTYTSAVLGCLVASTLATGVVVLSGLWLVKLAGALTLKVVAQARSIGLVLCSVFFFGEFCTGLQYLGYTITLLGMGLFDHDKQQVKRTAGGDVANARPQT